MFIVFFLTEAFYNSVDPWTCAERVWCIGSELPAARYEVLAMNSRLFLNPGAQILHKASVLVVWKTAREQLTYNVTLKRVHVTNVAEEKR
jgi:hypothetical protein